MLNGFIWLENVVYISWSDYSVEIALPTGTYSPASYYDNIHQLGGEMCQLVEEWTPV